MIIELSEISQIFEDKYYIFFIGVQNLEFKRKSL